MSRNPMIVCAIFTALTALSVPSGNAFQSILPTTTPAKATTLQPLFAGGFGGSKDKKSGGSKKDKLKPKQQWDRYSDMKTEEKIPVGVRIKDDDAEEEWLEVGRVRSKEGAHTAVAVALQRALIAEHAKRLYPLQVSNRKTLEWAYQSQDDWIVVDKAILEEDIPPEGIEKMIGFEGRPDPATGFYCVYDGGKLKLGDETSFN